MPYFYSHAQKSFMAEKSRSQHSTAPKDPNYSGAGLALRTGTDEFIEFTECTGNPRPSGSFLDYYQVGSREENFLVLVYIDGRVNTAIDLNTALAAAGVNSLLDARAKAAHRRNEAISSKTLKMVSGRARVSCARVKLIRSRNPR